MACPPAPRAALVRRSLRVSCQRPSHASASGAAAPALSTGRIVRLTKGGQSTLAVIVGSEGRRTWTAVDEFGEEHLVSRRDLSFVLSLTDCKQADLPRVAEESAALLGSRGVSELESLWEASPQGERQSLSALASQLYGEPASAVQIYAAHLLLAELDCMYFRWASREDGEDGYMPRPLSEVNQLRTVYATKQQEVLEAHEEECARRLAVNEVRAALEDPGRAEPLGDFASGLVEELERYVATDLRGLSEVVKRGAESTLRELGASLTKESACRTLQALGHWQLHENVFIRRHHVQLNFSSEAQERAAELLRSPDAAPPDPDGAMRVDLTSLKTITIDSADTREVDDGLSYELLPEGLARVWVHVADPTRWLALGDALDSDARRRGTSIYLPTGVVPMFPMELASGLMSLRQGETCCAMSVGATLSQDGEIVDSIVTPSLVRTDYRLTYDEADELLLFAPDEEQDLLEMQTLALRLHVQRRRRGAVPIASFDPDISVSPATPAGAGADAEIRLGQPLTQAAPARQLVQEFMIMAGDVVGRLGRDCAIPLPFRGQPPPRDVPSDEELRDVPAGPCRTVALRQCMTASTQSTRAHRHACLGLDAYVQFTSPIRRYTDLVAHFQLKAHLRGDPLPFPDDAELQGILQAVGDLSREGLKVSRQTYRYWIIEWFRRQPDETIYAITLLKWIKPEAGLALAYFERVGCELMVLLRSRPALGGTAYVRLKEANAAADRIKFAEASPKAAFAEGALLAD